MEKQKFKKIERKTSEYYKDIVDISYTPEEVCPSSVVRKKGDQYYWKLWGLIPLFRVKAKRTSMWCQELGIFYEDDFDNRYYPYLSYNLKSGQVVYRPSIKLKKSNNSEEVRYYDTDKEAYDAFEEICSYCKSLGVKLF